MSICTRLAVALGDRASACTRAIVHAPGSTALLLTAMALCLAHPAAGAPPTPAAEAAARTARAAAAANKTVGPAASSDWRTVRVISEQAPVLVDGKTAAAAPKDAVFGVLAVRDGVVQVQVCRDNRLLRGWIDSRHVAYVRDQDIDLGSAALAAMAVLRPQSDRKLYADRMNAIASMVAKGAAEGKTSREQVRLIGVQIFEQSGCRVPRGGPEDPEAQLSGEIDYLLDRKVGNCLSFSILYLAIARRLDLPVRMVKIPGHVALRCGEGASAFYIETTEKGRIYDDGSYLREIMQVALPGGYEGATPQELPHARAQSVLASFLGTALSQAGRLEEAGPFFERAAEIHPQLIDVYLNWGIYLHRSGRYQDACARYATCVDLLPRFPYAYFSWAGALIAMGQQEQASQKLQTACGLAPKFSLAHERRGILLASMGKSAEACRVYEQAIELCPNHVPLYEQWAETLMQTNQPKKAGEVCARGARIAPRHAGLRCRWGKALALDGDFARAAEQYEAAAGLDPKSAEAFFGWGLSLAMTGQNAPARQKLDQAAQLDPKLKPQVEGIRSKLGP